MCLKIKSTKPLIAKEDIVCYKVFFKTQKGKLRSVYYLKYWKLNKLYIDRPAVVIHTSQYPPQVGVYKGAYHSFKSLKNARSERKTMIEGTVMAKCIIPKGSTFYFGEFYDWEGYASKRLIIKSIIK